MTSVGSLIRWLSRWPRQSSSKKPTAPRSFGVRHSFPARGSVLARLDDGVGPVVERIDLAFPAAVAHYQGTAR